LYIFFTIIGIAAFLFIIRWLVTHKDTISFFISGIDSGFSITEIASLWKLAKLCDLEEPTALYLSVPALNRSISKLLYISRVSGTEFTKKTQDLLTKLYTYRTKVELDPLSKKGLKSSKYLDEGQRLRIVLKGVGVFSSRIEMNGHELIVSVPTKDKIITMYGSEWVGKEISVYLWRKDDAHYVFDSTVISAGQFSSKPVIYLTHSNDLTRVQKRKSVRTKCSISARMFLPGKDFTYDTSVENTAGGYRCLLEDISADGALIRIGGKGQTGARLKLQFPISDNYIVMAGVVRSVEYNKEKNQSRLHFECIHIEPEMRNVVLAFVYNVLPEEEREEIIAIQGTEEDSIAIQQETDAENRESSQNIKSQEEKNENISSEQGNELEEFPEI